jgi:hypothetical protein
MALLWGMKPTFSIPGLLGVLAAASLATAGDTSPLKRPGTLLIVHYRWKRDSLTLVESQRVPAKVKISRLTPDRLALHEAQSTEVPRSPFSYELMGADGKRIAVRYLQDPGIRRVEYQEKGERTLRTQVENVDSADIFLRIPEPDAQAIRFYRHAPPRAKAAPKAGVQGPQPLPAKTLLAEFPLE